MKNQKIIILALALLIIAGVIVVCLKGFSVDFMLKQHDSIEYRIDSDFEITDIENIAKEVFGNKKFKIRIIELFNDAVSINAEKITTEEAENLIKKLDEKYKTTEEAVVANDSTEVNTETQESTEAVEDVVDEATVDYTIISNPKIKLFSLIKMYIQPSIIAGIIIGIYTAIRYKKLNSLKMLLKLVVVILVTVLSILSIIAIVRYPINTYVFPIILFIVFLELIIFFFKQEQKLSELNSEE